MASRQKSARDYIEENDFDGAFERLQNATNKRWVNYWFGVCEQIACFCKEVAQKYILDPIQKTIVEKLKDTRPRVRWGDKIVAECDLLDHATQKCYLFEFYNSHGELVCSKVGTTIRKVTQRLKEELRSETYSKLDCQRAVIKKVYDCGTMPAEGAESYFRAYYIKKYPNSFKKNDRFMHQLFDFNFADRLMKKYLKNTLTS